MPDDAVNRWAEALARHRGRDYWRGLDELLQTPEFAAAVRREFPAGADQLEAGGMSRRGFLQLLGASLALAGVTGCVKRPREPILPYVRQPPGVTPGVPLHYATAMTLGGYGTGLLVESHAGRPTKIEGNPDHPASLGSAGVFEQASLLQLYDPHRARRIRRKGRPETWAALAATLAPGRMAQQVGARGAGLHLLLEPSSSPLLGAMLDRVRTRYPDATVHWYAPLASSTAQEGTAALFGRALQPICDPSAAAVIAAFDADFLGSGPFHLRYARRFADRRRLSSPVGAMNRLYAAEGAPSVTGTMADHRLPVRPGLVPRLLAALLARLRPGTTAPELPPEYARWIAALAEDLLSHRGEALVVVGDRQPADAHLLAAAINESLGGGGTINYLPPQLLSPGGDLGALTDAISAGGVHTLVILNGNPVYSAPPEYRVAEALAAVPQSVHLGLFRDETGAATTWQVPAAHYLESWGDTRALDGTVSLVQPLIAPLFGGRTEAELLAAVDGRSAAPHDLLQEAWRRQRPAGDFTALWESALHAGVVPDTAASPVRPSPRWGEAEAAAARAATAPQGGSDLEIVFAADATVYDGRFAGNPWLQELPDPITKLTWDNAALMSPRRAAALGREAGQLVSVTVGGRSLTLPALVVPGQADDAIVLPLGYGRRAPDEPVARGAGFDTYALRPRGAPYLASGTVAAAPGEYPLALTQTHWSMEGRPIVLTATLDEYRDRPQLAAEEQGPEPTLYDPVDYAQGDQWAMVIDLGVCTGCSACVVACQAENNIPVVGKEGVAKRREMHWIRIDRYQQGDPANPDLVTQPMLCQQCERAPCEYVCPVNATVHSPDGLNEMIYNRCVGTRFCSNNCPYKVRRFNWLDYHRDEPELVAMARNPDVTVRARGVMEKCTFCIQRIREAQIGAQVSGQPLGGDDVKTACQQACPTGAIVFGSYGDRDSAVAHQLHDPRAYQVLHDLGTKPRVRYLVRVNNPNPALERSDGQ